MEKIIWPTTSVWFDETIELFNTMEETDTPSSIAKKIKDGIIFSDMKESTAKRKWGTINARYFGQGKEKVGALKCIFSSSISKQDKQNYAFVFFIEYENLFRRIYL